MFTSLTDSLATDPPHTLDTIMDFNSGSDQFQIGHALAGLTTGLAHAGSGNLATDLMNTLTPGNLIANGAAEVTINGGTDAGTYLIINNGIAGFDAAHDAVIKLANGAVVHTGDFIV